MKFNLLAWCLVDVSDDKKNFRLGGTYQVLTGRASPEQRVAGLADQSTSSKRKQANRPAPEIIAEMNKMKDSAAGEDGIRLRFIKQADDEVKRVIIQKIQCMWEDRAQEWPASLKVGQIIALYKKGDKKDMNNYRGVCLLPIMSRILARVLATRIREWSEQLSLLDENQAGFRADRSTADATQIFVRINEDIKQYQRSRNVTDNAEAILLDLRKAYPRVNKPILWALLRRYSLPQNIINKLKDLHEHTSYKVKGAEGVSTAFYPERGLREGCATSPALFNIYHQAAIRIAESKREEAARENGKQCGIRWSYLPGNRFPPQRRGQQNSDASQKIFTLSLFADDTTVIGHNDEVEEGKRIVERCLLEFEEQTNLDKEEKMVFGDEKNNTEIRMLGTWMENNSDTTKRFQRAGKNWATIKRRFLKCRLTKRTQAKVVEACIESTMIFNASVRPFKLKEIKRMQTFMDKRYRYIWSDKNGQPLRQMEEKHLNMADIREQLNVTSLRTKIDKAHLLRMGHVLRMNDDRLVKQAVLGWYSKLEEENKTKKLPNRNTITYWRKLINEAGEDPNNIEHLITDRTKWRALVRNRVKHLEE